MVVAPPCLFLCLDHDLQQRVEPVSHLPGPPREPLQVPSPAHPHVVLDVERPHHLRHLLGALPRRLRHVARQIRGHHAHDGVVGEADELAAEVERLAPAGGVARRAQHGGQLRLPHGAQLVHGARAEQLRHAEALHEAPVRAVGGEGEARRVVGQVPRDRRERALRDAGLELEQVARGVGGAGDHAVGGGAEPEVDEGTVAGDDAVQGAVRGRTDKVQVADQGEGKRARRQLVAASSSSPADDDDERAEDDGDQQGSILRHRLDLRAARYVVVATLELDGHC